MAAICVQWPLGDAAAAAALLSFLRPSAAAAATQPQQWGPICGASQPASQPHPSDVAARFYAPRAPPRPGWNYDPFSRSPFCSFFYFASCVNRKSRGDGGASFFTRMRARRVHAVQAASFDSDSRIANKCIIYAFARVS